MRPRIEDAAARSRLGGDMVQEKRKEEGEHGNAQSGKVVRLGRAMTRM